MSYSIQPSNTQKQLLLNNLLEFYNNKENMNNMIRIINGETKISLRIIDWFVTNYSKKNYTVYSIPKIINGEPSPSETTRFKVYNEYKLKLKAYSKKNFDPFCRWERITIPYDNDNYIETTIGQLNFFKWAIECKIIDFIQENYSYIEADMNTRNSTSKLKTSVSSTSSSSSSSASSCSSDNGKTRKKREELSISACKCIKKENVQIVVKFN
jgi:hypothetical protein